MVSQKRLADAIRILSMDAVQKANSGHPGMPMGMADIAQVLWHEFLQHNPTNPNWWNRDRFILSNGHGSMLLYALLHLTGYAVSLEDLKQFRQLHSITPGHPEHGLTPGVEVTTGPLGQGLAAALGMAIAEQLLANEFNTAEYPIIDHFTYCFVGDGCLMEGISHEAASLAGTLGVGKLIVFWDDNGVSIDGQVAHWFADDTAKRFAAYNWQVISQVDGHDPTSIREAIVQAKSELTRPSIICCQTKIGYGAPTVAGSAKCHGAPLGEQEIKLARAELDWDEQAFFVPPAVYASWNALAKGQQQEQQWNELWDKYRQQYPAKALELARRKQKQLSNSWKNSVAKLLHQYQATNASMATRKASLQVLNDFIGMVPELLGGSADLSCSNLTMHKQSRAIRVGNLQGNYIDYGVREFGMSAMMNGLAVYGGFIPYGGTFLSFADYAKNAVRMSALMQQRVIYVYTHDSIGLGEDGPTHQPVEHLAMLRMIPNVTLWRPCDAVETLVAWQQAMEKLDGPSCLALSRQTLPGQMRNSEMLNNISRGAYILFEAQDNSITTEHQSLDAILIATGSEVIIAMDAAQQLQGLGYRVRVVSMPSMDVFLQQDSNYQESILPKKVLTRIAIEAGATAIWHQFVGLSGKVVGLDRFGESAPAKDIFEAVNISVTKVVEVVQACLTSTSGESVHAY